MTITRLNDTEYRVVTDTVMSDGSRNTDVVELVVNHADVAQLVHVTKPSTQDEYNLPDHVYEMSDYSRRNWLAEYAQQKNTIHIGMPVRISVGPLARKRLMTMAIGETATF